LKNTIYFGDCDGVENRQGFKLLREDNNQILFSMDVVFDVKEEITPLKNYQLDRNEGNVDTNARDFSISQI